mmetsp:Transcript_23693/g.29375  ORF Transcript_23693/g.29375 Transcript_23693/m.29375 type:complete len:260 (+) Transcript_23693:806-1585(+)
MARLFHENRGAILALGLVRFAEDRVQRLFENLFLVKERNVVSDGKLHPFDRVLNARSFIQVDSHGTLERGHNFKSGGRAHALDRETDLGKVSVSAKQLFADHLHDLSSCRSQTRQQDLVSAAEAAIVSGIGAAMITRKARWLELLGVLDDLLSSLPELSFLLIVFVSFLFLGVWEKLEGKLLHLSLNVEVLLELISLDLIEVEILAGDVVKDILGHAPAELLLTPHNLVPACLVAAAFLANQIQNLAQLIVNFFLVSER